MWKKSVVPESSWCKFGRCRSRPMSRPSNSWPLNRSGKQHQKNLKEVGEGLWKTLKAGLLFKDIQKMIRLISDENLLSYFSKENNLSTSKYLLTWRVFLFGIFWGSSHRGGSVYPDQTNKWKYETNSPGSHLIIETQRNPSETDPM